MAKTTFRIEIPLKRPLAQRRTLREGARAHKPECWIDHRRDTGWMSVGSGLRVLYLSCLFSVIVSQRNTIAQNLKDAASGPVNFAAAFIDWPSAM
jgi:hypothetical protein